jgi:hypothetical protein
MWFWSVCPSLDLQPLVMGCSLAMPSPTKLRTPSLFAPGLFVSRMPSPTPWRGLLLHSSAHSLFARMPSPTRWLLLHSLSFCSACLHQQSVGCCCIHSLFAPHGFTNEVAWAVVASLSFLRRMPSPMKWLLLHSLSFCSVRLHQQSVGCCCIHSLFCSVCLHQRRGVGLLFSLSYLFPVQHRYGPPPTRTLPRWRCHTAFASSGPNWSSSLKLERVCSQTAKNRPKTPKTRARIDTHPCYAILRGSVWEAPCTIGTNQVSHTGFTTPRAALFVAVCWLISVMWSLVAVAELVSDVEAAQRLT